MDRLTIKQEKALKKKWKNKCKKTFRALILCISGFKCVRCGKVDGKLDTSHIFPKGAYPHMEFEIDNAKTLCFRCHRLWWHLNPIEGQTWIKIYLGKKRFERLCLMREKYVQINWQFYKETFYELEDKLEFHRCRYE